jgi:hypothetical protein
MVRDYTGALGDVDNVVVRYFVLYLLVILLHHDFLGARIDALLRSYMPHGIWTGIDLVDSECRTGGRFTRKACGT